ncbi:unnamed protein product [Didymodactylos carnosus]|uniref:Uncharacterized protein n=1 Tax=Didymodactylos carnosus TaxID=1234261 RepID=A0A814KV06_9BILA|nr:unnamed protein product [Didymodactylos carnosus]CAF1631951.1 unnamed protein product [Didymodactylos carnosus]CAF3823955.1 unnamed protein product [Didymodactylos carnosus]CAF4459004.1 unnamed protein product [Didymodactylos carnosus]
MANAAKYIIGLLALFLLFCCVQSRTLYQPKRAVKILGTDAKSDIVQQEHLIIQNTSETTIQASQTLRLVSTTITADKHQQAAIDDLVTELAAANTSTTDGVLSNSPNVTKLKRAAFKHQPITVEEPIEKSEDKADVDDNQDGGYNDNNSDDDDNRLEERR